MSIRKIVVSGKTNSAPYEIDFQIGSVGYIYGASYDICRKCLFIDKKCGYSGERALNYIKIRADYCLKYGGDNEQIPSLVAGLGSARCRS